MKFLQFAIAASVALLFSGAALTQMQGTATAPVDPPATLSTLDTNKDGSISLGEATRNSALTRQFPALDENANGALEPGEFARFEVIGAASTRGTPGDPGSSGSPPSAGSAPSGTTPPPSGSTTPPSGG